MKRGSWWAFFAWVVVCVPIAGIGLAVFQISKDAGYSLAILGMIVSYFVVIPKVQGWLDNSGNSISTQT